MTWYRILAKNALYNLALDSCGENYNLDSHGLIIATSMKVYFCNLEC